MTRPALIADLDRCTGCRSCVVACKEEKRLPPGLFFIRVEQVGPDGVFPDLNMYYLPLACQQCGQPACAAACPEGAIHPATNGLVVVDGTSCTGCGDCIGACPYGAIVLDAGAAVACKCDLCSELLAAGRAPACVASCPGKALAVIGLDTPASGAPVPRKPAQSVQSGLPGRADQEPGRRRVVELLVLKPEAGTRPSGRFVLTRQEWRA